jgi:exodeoxyribonuclease VII large subunit
MVYFEERQQQLDLLTERLGRAMAQRLGSAAGELEKRAGRLPNAAAMLFAGKRKSLETMAAGLDAMSPLKVLYRGYSITETDQGRAVRSAKELSPGDHISIRLHEGRVSARVEALEEEGT